MRNLSVTRNEKKNPILKMDNRVIEAKFDLRTLEEMRMFGIVLSKIQKNDEDFKIYSIKVSDIEKLTSTTKRKERLKILAKKMLKKTIFIENGKSWSGYSLFSKIEYKDGEELLIVQLHPDVRDLFLQLKSEFTTAGLMYYLSLGSYYAVRIYLMLKQYQRIGKRVFDLDKLKEWLGTPDSYNKNFNLFKKKVLDVATNEINEKTDLKVDWSIKSKKGKSIKEIEFIIKEKPKQIINSTFDIFSEMDFNEFRKFLIKKGHIFIKNVNGQYYQVKMGYLLDENENFIDKSEALLIWHDIYENRKNIKILTPKEYEQEKPKIDFSKVLQEIQNKIYFQVIDYGDFIDEIEFNAQIDDFKREEGVVKGKMINRENPQIFVNFETNIMTLFESNKFEIDITDNKIIFKK